MWKWRFAIASLLALAGLSGAWAQARNIEVQPRPGAPAVSAYRDSWAVVIGVNDYQHPRIPKLRAAVNDALAVERALVQQGFRRDRIVKLVDRQATKTAIERVLGDQLRTQMGEDDRLLVFFAGHGKTERRRSGEQEGYLLAVDSDPGQVYSTGISMESLRRISDRLPAKHILYVIDACYSGYAKYNRSISDDLLEEMVKKPAIQILTAGRDGDEAQERGGHGVFTDVFLRGIQGDAFTGGKGWLALEELGVWVKERVYAESGKRQVPQFGNLHGEGQFVFVRPGAKVAAVPPAPPSPAPAPPKVIEEVRVGTLAISGKTAGVEIWLGDQKMGETRAGRPFVIADLTEGRHRIVARKAGHKDWDREVDVVANQRTEVTIDIELLGPPKMLKTEDGAEMVLVPAGEFVMGSNDYADETPPRRVHLDAFHIDKFEVTNRLYGRFMQATFVVGPRAPRRPAPAYWTNSSFNDGSQPVVGVTWHDADAYCKGAGKRLPTEAEWEKAARGTDGRKYPWGEQWEASRANSWETRLGRAAAVGSYPSGASPYGVHDMAGNVWEWVADWYDQDYYKQSPQRNPSGPASGRSRVLRGGSWGLDPVPLRTANRVDYTPGSRDFSIGFRCARGLP